MNYGIYCKEAGSREWYEMKTPYPITVETIAQNIVLKLTQNEKHKKPGNKAIYQYKEKK